LAFKRIKTYCRSTQSQDRLSTPGILPIEKKVVEDFKKIPLFYSKVIEKFVEKERRIEKS